MLIRPPPTIGYGKYKSHGFLLRFLSPSSPSKNSFCPTKKLNFIAENVIGYLRVKNENKKSQRNTCTWWSTHDRTNFNTQPNFKRLNYHTVLCCTFRHKCAALLYKWWGKGKQIFSRMFLRVDVSICPAIYVQHVAHTHGKFHLKHFCSTRYETKL